MCHTSLAAYLVCSATKDSTTVLSAPITMGLDDSLEYCGEDELVEVLRLTHPLLKNFDPYHLLHYVDRWEEH